MKSWSEINNNLGFLYWGIGLWLYTLGLRYWNIVNKSWKGIFVMILGLTILFIFQWDYEKLRNSAIKHGDKK